MCLVKGSGPLNQLLAAQEFLNSLHASLLLYGELDYSQKPCYVLPHIS